MLPEHQAPETRPATDRDPSSPLRTPTDPQPTPERSPGQDLPQGADGDLVVDVPHLKVDELVLDLAATLALDHVKVEAKGLDLGLFLKADVAKLAGPGARRSRPLDIDGEASDHDHERSRLRRLLCSSDGHAAPDAQPAAENGSATSHRALHLAKEGGKAASLAAAGLAGGALLESRRHRSPSLPQALRDHGTELAQRAGGAILDQARETSFRLPSPLRRRRSGPAGVLDRVREQLH